MNRANDFMQVGRFLPIKLDRNSHNQILKELESIRGHREETHSSQGKRDSWLDRWNPSKKDTK